ELAAVADVDGAGGERDLGIGGAVEEVRRGEVGGEVLVLDLEGIDLDGPLQDRRAVLGGPQRAGVVLEAAAEGRHDHVLDGEAGVGVDRVDRPVPGSY